MGKFDENLDKIDVGVKKFVEYLRDNFVEILGEIEACLASRSHPHCARSLPLRKITAFFGLDIADTFIIFSV